MNRKALLIVVLLSFACFGVANAQTLFSEDFEDGSMPTGWTTSGNGSWSVATAVNATHPASAGHGTYCAQIKHGTTGNATKLITPEIDLSTVTSAELSFMHAEQSWSGDIDGLKVYYRTSSSGTWTQLVEYTTAYDSWTTEEGIVLPNLSSTYQLAFEYIDHYGYGLGIDYVNIVETLPLNYVTNITSTEDWNEFCRGVNRGLDYNGMTVTLANDISVSTTAGIQNYPFTGTFDGQGNTLTVNIASIGSPGNAPFHYISNATIRNLVVEGTVNAGSGNSNRHAAGLVGYVWSGTNTLEQCLVKTNVNSGCDYAGGIIGHGKISNIVMTGCVYMGTITATGTNPVGGLIGWSDNLTGLTLTDCFFNGSYSNSNSSRKFHPIGCTGHADQITATRTITRCHYTLDHSNLNSTTQTLVYSLNDWGKHVYSIVGDTGISVDLDGNATNTYSYSQLAFYNVGLTSSNVIYAANGDQVSLNLDGSSDGYSAIPGTLTGDSNPYTITMGSNNTLIIGGTISYITEINSSEDWITFCHAINDLGHDYSGETVTLMTDITISTAAAANDTPFRGTFNGNGNTITLDFGSTSNYLDQRCAPFYRIGNATIKDVAVDGNIYSSQQNNASLVCRVETGTNNYIINCISSVSIHSNRSGDGTNGGLVALLNSNNCTVNFEGCAFVGELIGSNTSNWGGFVGWRDYQNGNYNYANFTDCFFGPTTVNISTSSSTNSRTFCRSRDNTTSGATYTNCYYTTTVQANDGGRQAYTITGDEGITVDFNGDPTTIYSMSGLSFYDAGFECNNVLYASSGDNVSLNLEGSDNGYTAIPGELTGDSNPYTLQMTAANTLITTHIEHITEINNVDDWNAFCLAVNSGHTYAGETVNLNADISVTTMAGQMGSGQNPFEGTFDGHGNTITVDYTSTGIRCSVFPTANRATFKNLIVDGHMSVSHFPAGGIIGYVHYECHIINCVSNVEITCTSSDSGNSGVGGILGEADRSSNPQIYFEGCAFTGKLIGNCNGWGGFVGRNRGYVNWSGSNSDIYFTNCMFAPTSLPESTSGCATFARSDSYSSESNSHIHINNCYYTQALGQAQGKQAYTITCDEGITVDFYGDPTTIYSMSGLSFYDAGFECNNVLYASSGDNVSLNLEGSDNGYTAIPGELTGDSNPYTLQMTAANTLITTHIEHITEINNVDDWNAFCLAVNSGHTYAGETVNLNADISVTTMAGQMGSGQNPFEGTFDGHGNTITVDYTSTGIRCSVFPTANRATFKNLIVDGHMSVSHFPAGGIIGYVHYECHIINCVSNVEITCTSSDSGNSGVGGILGEADRSSNPQIYFEGCAFTGKLIGNCNGWGGFVGRNRGYVNWSGSNSDIYFTNCMFAPTSLPESTSGCATFARSDTYSSESNSHIHITNCYYTQTLGQVQGKKAYSITSFVTNINPITVELYGEHTYYDVSDIDGYNVGIVYNGTIYAGNGDNVALALEGSPSGAYDATYGTITGTENPFTLAMVAHNTEISALTCPAPTGLEETEITAYNATLNWNGISDNYNVRFYEAVFFDSFEEDLSQWTIYHEGDESTWEWGIENPNDNSSDLSAHSGNFAVVAYGMDSVQADNWLISPQIEFPTQTTLKFWVMRSTYEEFKDEYEVLLSTTGNAIEDFTTILKESEVANSYWTEVVIDLSEYDGETGYIAIRHNHYHGFFIMVDDFGIYGWSELIPVNGNSYTLEGLQPDTYYQWQVQADCGEEDGVSFWSETSSFKTLETCPTPFNLTASEVTAYGATLNWTGYSESYEVMVGELETTTSNYDFEEDTIISADFSNTSAHPWTVVSGGLNGSYCIKSGNAGQASSTSSISLTMNLTSNGTIEFDAECMGEGTSSLWDHCDFYIDNTRKLYYGANVSGWNHYSFAVTAGEHTFTWSYTKDGSVDPNGDYFAVDNIVVESTNIASWMSYEVSEPPFVLVDAENIQTNTSYVVKVKGFCEDEETEYSDAVTFTTLGENTKIFVFEGEWSDGDNWVPAGVPSIEQDVILRAEATVFDVAEANTITIDDAGTLTIEDGGQLKTNADVEATMKKFIIGYGTDYVETDNGYYLMTLPTAAPISAADAHLLTEESDYDLYSWDRTAIDEEWQNNHDGIDLQNGVGFLYANRDDMEMFFTATLRNSSEPVVVTPAYDEVEHGGWNLCGNPFPCEAYITTDAEGMAFYRLVDNQLELIEGAIAPLEAFFVKATAAGQSFTISREAPEESKSPTNGNTNRFKVSTVTK